MKTIRFVMVAYEVSSLASSTPPQATPSTATLDPDDAPAEAFEPDAPVAPPAPDAVAPAPPVASDTPDPPASVVPAPPEAWFAPLEAALSDPQSRLKKQSPRTAKRR